MLFVHAVQIDNGAGLVRRPARFVHADGVCAGLQAAERVFAVFVSLYRQDPGSIGVLDLHRETGDFGAVAGAVVDLAAFDAQGLRNVPEVDLCALAG